MNGCFHRNLNLLCKQFTIIHPTMSLQCLWGILGTLRNLNKGFNASYSSIGWPYYKKWKMHPNYYFLHHILFWLIQCLLQCCVWGTNSLIQRCLQSFVRYHWPYLIPPTMFLSTLIPPYVFSTYPTLRLEFYQSP